MTLPGYPLSDSVLKDKQDLMERQVKSLEHIAEQAYAQATSQRPCVRQ